MSVAAISLVGLLGAHAGREATPAWAPSKSIKDWRIKLMHRATIEQPQPESSAAAQRWKQKLRQRADFTIEDAPSECDDEEQRADVKVLCLS